MTKDCRIKLYSKPNGGLSSARNLGLAHSNGEYIYFLDGDDYVDKDMMHTLVSIIKKTKSDIAVCGKRDIYLNKSVESSYTGEVREILIQDAYEYLIPPNDFIRFEVWNKLYRKEVISDIRFKDRQIYEDVYFQRMVFKNCSKIVYIDKPFYNYLIEREGNTNSTFKKEKLCVINELKQYVNDLAACGLKNESVRFMNFTLFFTMDMYCNAVRLNADKVLVNMIYDEFKAMFLENRKKQSVKTYMFRYLPMTYAIISNCKHKI